MQVVSTQAGLDPSRSQTLCHRQIECGDRRQCEQGWQMPLLARITSSAA